MRLQLAQALAGPPEERPRAIAASVQSLLQPIPRLRDLEAEFLQLRTGEVLDVRALPADVSRPSVPSVRPVPDPLCEPVVCDNFA